MRSISLASRSIEENKRVSIPHLESRETLIIFINSTLILGFFIFFDLRQQQFSYTFSDTNNGVSKDWITQIGVKNLCLGLQLCVYCLVFSSNQNEEADIGSLASCLCLHPRRDRHQNLRVTLQRSDQCCVRYMTT